MSDKKKEDTAGLFIPNRQLSFAVGAVFSLAAASFIGGYFLGKQHAIEPFVLQAESDSFADQLYASLCARYDIDMAERATHHTPQDEPEPEPVQTVQELPQSDEQKDEESSEKWYAQLIGYGKEKSAQAFAHKLQKNGMPVLVTTRESSTPKGRKRTWYQVVTAPYEDRNALQLVVDKIVHEEKLKGVQISTC